MDIPAQALGLKLQRIAVRDPDNIAQAFAQIGRDTNGLMISGAGLFLRTAKQSCEPCSAGCPQRRTAVFSQTPVASCPSVKIYLPCTVARHR